MNFSHFASATSRPYSSLLRQATILGKLFSSKQLAFNMEHQTQTNWCWAATSKSVSHFYWITSSWTQCLVANAELSLSNCCDSSVPAACNIPWYLDRALTRTNNFVSITGQVSFEQVKSEIDAGRPVGARIGWSGGGGHFMVIYGYSSVAGTDYFDIDDPIYGKSHLTVSDFANNYQGSGTWTHTYFTKTFIQMPIKVLIPIEAVRRRIWEVRPLLNLKRDMSFAERAGDDVPTDASLGMTQRVYSLGLNSLLDEPSPAPQPVNLRVYEMSGTTPRAYFDVTESAEPRVLQMSASERHLNSFARSLTTALRTTESSDEECELRLFRVPALNFEALWLNYEGHDRDLLVPLHAGPLPENKPVPMAEALKVLREAARPLAQMDETMGA